MKKKTQQSHNAFWMPWLLLLILTGYAFYTGQIKNIQPDNLTSGDDSVRIFAQEQGCSKNKSFIACNSIRNSECYWESSIKECLDNDFCKGFDFRTCYVGGTQNRCTYSNGRCEPFKELNNRIDCQAGDTGGECRSRGLVCSAKEDGGGDCIVKNDDTSVCWGFCALATQEENDEENNNENQEQSEQKISEADLISILQTTATRVEGLLQQLRTVVNRRSRPLTQSEFTALKKAIENLYDQTDFITGNTSISVAVRNINLAADALQAILDSLNS